MLFWLVCLSLLQSLFALEVQGHRGARAKRPENTMPAFIYAEAHGADVLEMDLNVSRDGVLVISHDPFINPVHCSLEKPLFIHDLTLNEIQSYDCGSKKNPRFPDQELAPGTKIPSFEELLTWAKSKKVGLNVETKIFPAHPEWSPAPEEFARLVVKALRDHKMIERTVIESFDQRTLIALKKLEPRLKTALLTSENHLDFVGAARAAKADILSPHFEWILPEDVKALHAHKIKVLPWTANEPAEWKRLIDMGVDGIISDNPQGLSDYLKTNPH